MVSIIIRHSLCFQISLANVKYLILDEADRMLDMGFMGTVKTIVEEFQMPGKDERQTLMFSATFPEEIQRLAAEFLNDYVFLTVGKVGGASFDIEQVIEEVSEADKRDKLVEILGSEGKSATISSLVNDYFCNWISLHSFSNNHKSDTWLHRIQK